MKLCSCSNADDIAYPRWRIYRSGDLVWMGQVLPPPPLQVLIRAKLLEDINAPDVFDEPPNTQIDDILLLEFSEVDGYAFRRATHERWVEDPFAFDSIEETAFSGQAGRIDVQ